MNGSEHLRQTLEYYKQQLQKKREELRPLELMIRQLERELGEAANGQEPAEIGVSASDSSAMADSFAGVLGNRPPEIRPDEFFGMSQSEAAKAYLRKIGRAVSLDELVTCLNKGGARVGGANPKRTLYVSLMRNPMREFVSPSENHIGLRAFYPGLPKAEKARSAKVRKPKPTKRHRATGRNRAAQQKKAANEGKDEPAAPNRIRSTLIDALSTGEAQTKAELVKAVEAKLGQVPRIAVFGALRSKEFREVDGKIKLAR